MQHATPLVSIITPTFGREHMLADTWRVVASQTYPGIEWLVLDDSPQPSALLSRCDDARVSYEHVGQRLSIGEKRNRLVARARGAIIAHFDDDDSYAPHYLATMVATLEQANADFASLSSWFLYDFRHQLFGFWALRVTVGTHYLCYRDQLRVVEITERNNANLRDNFRA